MRTGNRDRVRAVGVQRQLTCLSDIAGIAEQWRALARGGSPVAGPDWALAWAETFGPAYEFRLLTTSAAGRLTGVLPLVRRRSGPRRYELLGARDLLEPVDAVWADQEALTGLVRQLAALRSSFLLQRVPADSALVPAVTRGLRRSSVFNTRASSGTPWLPLDPSWVDSERHFDAGRRSDFRRAQRRAQALGQVECSVLRPEPAEVGALFDEVVAVEGAGWKGAAGTALAVVPVMAAFYRRLAELTAAGGSLWLAFLRIDGQPAAVQLAVVHASRLWLCKIGYDARFGRCSPGSLLMLHVIRKAALTELDSIEFLGHEESWTSLWAPQVRRCVRVRGFTGASGASVFAGEALEWTARRARSGVTQVRARNGHTPVGT